MKSISQSVIQLLKIPDLPSNQNLQDTFNLFLKLSLWSNRCDLSLSDVNQLSTEESTMHKLNAYDEFILSNDSPKIYEYLNQSSKNGIIGL